MDSSRLHPKRGGLADDLLCEWRSHAADGGGTSASRSRRAAHDRGRHRTPPIPPRRPLSPFEGLVDELTLYDRALSGTEIQLIVAAERRARNATTTHATFSATANPNGLWRFGWIDGNAFDPAFSPTPIRATAASSLRPQRLMARPTVTPPRLRPTFSSTSRRPTGPTFQETGACPKSAWPPQFALEESDDGDLQRHPVDRAEVGHLRLSGTSPGSRICRPMRSCIST